MSRSRWLLPRVHAGRLPQNPPGKPKQHQVLIKTPNAATSSLPKKRAILALLITGRVTAMWLDSVLVVDHVAEAAPDPLGLLDDAVKAGDSVSSDIQRVSMLSASFEPAK